MSFLSEVDTTRSTLEGSDTFVYSLVHIPVAGRGEDLERVAQLDSDLTSVTIKMIVSYLAARLARILSLFQLLVTLFMCLVVAPESEGFGAERTGDRALVTHPFTVLVRRHLRSWHSADVTSIADVFICK